MATEKKPLRGVDLMRATINQIIKHPLEWDQTRWHCETTHCFAGWCQILGGNKADGKTCPDDAQEMLSLSNQDISYLLSPGRIFADLYAAAKYYIASADEIFNARDYGIEGYSRIGVNIRGKSHDGYDRDGLDCDGYDRDGYNSALGHYRDGLPKGLTHVNGRRAPLL